MTTASVCAADQIIHTTVRIETVDSAGRAGSGTGFFIQLCEDGDKHVPAIVTNRHVVEGAVEGAFYLTQADAGGPKLGQKVRVPIAQFENHWIKHPDGGVDLAALPIAGLMKELEKRGTPPYFKSWGKTLLADDALTSELTAIEEVLMVGYPKGLWDRENNLPIVRRGITATPAYVDFEKRPEFMIDCACFPGSSGSPVILYSMGTRVAKSGQIQLGTSRVSLLGVLYGGPIHTAEGEIVLAPAPTSVRPISLSAIPINLGYCVKASQLLAFEQIFASALRAQETPGASAAGAIAPAA